MKRTVCILVLVISCIFVLAGCQCEHDWKAATCTDAKTCSLCEETEGAPLGHTWKAATCVAPKTCETCKVTEGKPNEHRWEDADCTTPKTCTGCGITEGEALGHQWLDATTEAPKTCSDCGTTEGERIITDPRFKTADAKVLFGTWKSRDEITSDTLGLPAMNGKAAEVTVFQFNNDGTMKVYCEIENKDIYIALMKAATIKEFYDSFALQGLNEEQANQAMQQVYNMTIEEYAEDAVEQTISAMESVSIEGVYYVQDGNVYSGPSWEDELDREEVFLDGDTLKLIDQDGDYLALTRS